MDTELPRLVICPPLGEAYEQPEFCETMLAALRGMFPDADFRLQLERGRVDGTFAVGIAMADVGSVVASKDALRHVGSVADFLNDNFLEPLVRH